MREDPELDNRIQGLVGPSDCIQAGLTTSTPAALKSKTQGKLILK